MSKASEWSSGFGKRPTFQTEHTGIEFAKVADNGTLEFTVRNWPKSNVPEMRMLPDEALSLAQWIFDTFGEVRAENSHTKENGGEK